MIVLETAVRLVGEIALLLWGIHMVHTGILRAYGGQLRLILGQALKNRMSAFAAGLGVTTLLQSSTATGMMATSFAADGMVALVPALAIMLGANVGTTLIVQVLSFDISLVYPVLIFAGYVAFNRGESRVRDLGRVGIGLGLILLSLELLVESITPLAALPQVRTVLEALEAYPFLYVIIACFVTWAAHSSVATVLLVMSLADVGAVSAEGAIALVLGANLGSAINPVLEGAGTDPVRLRLPAGNLFNRIVGIVLVLALLHPITRAMVFLDAEPDRLTANFHTAFNAVLALLFMPILPAYARLLERIFRARQKPVDPAAPRHLDEAALDNPSVALANAAREAIEVADMIEAMLNHAREALHSTDRGKVQGVTKEFKIIDLRHTAIEEYLTDIKRDLLSEDDGKRLSDILNFTLNLKTAGAIISKNLMVFAARRIKNGTMFPAEDWQEIDRLFDDLKAGLKLATAVFLGNDKSAAIQLVREKGSFRAIERAATERHFQRVREGHQNRIIASGLQLDIVRELKRIDSYIVAVAYPLLEEKPLPQDQGELNATEEVLPTG